MSALEDRLAAALRQEHKCRPMTSVIEQQVMRM
jgi:hypothetical protein